MIVAPVAGKHVSQLFLPGMDHFGGSSLSPRTLKSRQIHTHVCFLLQWPRGQVLLTGRSLRDKARASRKRLLCSDMDSGPNSAYAPSEKRCGMQELMHASVCIDPWSVVHNRGEEWELQLGIAMPGQCPHSAHSVPTRCPLQCPHSAHW